MKRFFEIAWEIAPDQPCCADVWSGFTDDHANTEIEQAALEMSDIVSYHQYGPYETNIALIESLRKIGRPALNTEWLHRINGNNVEMMYPLFYLEKIGCYNFGFAAGKYQLYEPWEGIWQQMEGAFGVDKEDYGFRRFLTRGTPKTETQFFLIAFAFNIRKLCARIESGRFGNSLFETDAA